MIRPQDNFYLYINQKWLEKTIIPKDKSSVNSFSMINDSNRKKLLSILETNKNNLPNKLFKQGIKHNTNNGLIPFIKMINSINTKEDLIDVFAQFILYGITTPLSIVISIDTQDSNKYSCEISPSGIFLPTKEYYTKEKLIITKYKKLIKNILNYFRKTNIDDIVYEVEEIISKKHLLPEEYNDIYNFLTLKELKTFFPNLDFEKIFSIMNIKLNNRKIQVYSPQYLRFLNNLINKIPLYKWKIYLFWCLIQSIIPNNDIDNLFFEFYGKVLNGQEKINSKKKRIYTIVTNYTQDLCSELYVKKFFNLQIKKNVEKMIVNIKNETIEYIKNIHWMNNKTKRNAIRKLQCMKYKVGYPTKIHRFENLKLHSNFSITLLNMNKYLIDNMIKRFNLNKSVNKHAWFMGAFEVNAYYMPSYNELVIPAGILAEPFYSLKQSDIQNLAGIGYVIGHEIIHSLDDLGRKFDWKGNKKDWWTSQDEQNYEKMSKKLIKQYNNYTIHKKNINGTLTFGENFADLLGFNMAYNFCKKKYNTTQDKILFFSHFAKVKRNKTNKENILNRLYSDSHSPSEFRVNGVLSLINDFYDIYEVIDGDQMFIPPNQRIKY